MQVLVTGANGFIGRNLCATLRERGEQVRCALRIPPQSVVSSGKESVFTPSRFDWVTVGDIGPTTDWTSALQDVEVVVHLAGRAHVMKEHAKDPLAEYRWVNVLGTERLVRMALTAGVHRLVYVSSIGVNGRVTTDRPLTENSPVNPEDPYAVSKWEAETMLRKIAERSDLEIVIVRPPLVYGPDVRGNFLRLLHWVYKGMPLPFRNINNRRSLLALKNLVDILVLCIWSSNAAGETFLVSDGESLSAPELIRRLAKALGRPARLLPFPVVSLRLAARLLGREKDMERLFSSLVVNSSKAMRVLNWFPSLSVEEGLERTARWYLAKYG